MMTVREFLNEVRKLVLQFSLGNCPVFVNSSARRKAVAKR